MYSIQSNGEVGFTRCKFIFTGIYNIEIEQHNRHVIFLNNQVDIYILKQDDLNNTKVINY